MMRYFKMRATAALSVLGMSLCLAGCADGTVRESGQADIFYGMGSMEETPRIEYVVPRQFPGILVDRRGYSAEDVKEAIVRAKELPESFFLIDAKTGETAYEGSVEQGAYCESEDCYIGIADFSEVNLQGTYYVKCDRLGRSYTFVIGEQFYQEMFLESYERLLESCERKELTVLEAVKFLEVYEWYKELFPDRNHNNTPDVLEQLQGWVTYMEENGVESEQEALYAAFLAKLGYNYKDYHYQYATECLKRAATVYGQLPDDDDMGGDRFFALAELYRATGLYTYRGRLLQYKALFADNLSYLEEESYLYGAMTYLMTRQNVDRELCETFIRCIRDRGEYVSVRYRDMLYTLGAKGEDQDADALLKPVMELSCANFILNNYQYTNMIREFMHYLMGRNPESENLCENGGDATDYLLLFAQLASNLNEI